MNPVILKPIIGEVDHAEALALLDPLMAAEAGTREAAMLRALAVLIQDYEARAHPLPAPTPLDAIRFRMEQGGLSQADLARLLGSRSRASELLGGKLRRLSATMIERLHRGWGIPAEALIGSMRMTRNRKPEPGARRTTATTARGHTTSGRPTGSIGKPKRKARARGK